MITISRVGAGPCAICGADGDVRITWGETEGSACKLHRLEMIRTALSEQMPKRSAPPLVKGGQGRGDRETEDCGTAGVVCLVMLLAIVGAAIVGAVIG